MGPTTVTIMGSPRQLSFPVVGLGPHNHCRGGTHVFSLSSSPTHPLALERPTKGGRGWEVRVEEEREMSVGPSSGPRIHFQPPICYLWRLGSESGRRAATTH